MKGAIKIRRMAKRKTKMFVVVMMNSEATSERKNETAETKMR